MKNLTLSVIITPLLIACGGGGGGDGGSGGGTTPATPIAKVSKTTDLVAPDGFDYNPIESRALTVDISSQHLQRAYLSVYSNYVVVDGGVKVPDYGSRIAAVQLDKGIANVNLSIADSEEEVLAEIWFYDGSTPLQRSFTTDQNNWYW